MNKEEIVKELSRISTPTGLTSYGDYTLDDYTCDKILDFINEETQENLNLKQALREIREILDNEIVTPSRVIAIKNTKWGNNISQIIDKVLGGN